MTLHTEINLENEICDHLAAHGWLYEKDAASVYDRPAALFPPDLFDWISATQPEAWESINKSQGSEAKAHILARVRKQLDERGTLEVLRHGVDFLGLRQKLVMAQFKPAHAFNEDLQARYAANRLRVVRQVHYSQYNEQSIDLVLFLNGIPVATAELKSDFTQSVADAVDQYRYDRYP